MTIIVAKQMIIMGIFMIVGAVLFKTKLITQEGNKTLVNILIYLITPVALFRSMCRERTPEVLKSFAVSFALCALVQLIGIVASHIIFKKNNIEEFSTAYPNAGFFGIPVIQAILGEEAVFYMAPLVFFVGALQHTYGVYLLVRDKKTALNWKRIVFSPNTVGLIAGFAALLLNIGSDIPPVVNQCINSIANMSAFFAMTILGIFMVQADFTQLFKNLKIYLVAFFRLLLIPLFCTVIFKFINVDYQMKMAILLAFAGPVGSNVANYSLLYNQDYGKASLYVTVSTVLCLFTLPLFEKISEMIL